jgi:hypothetical protein
MSTTKAPEVFPFVVFTNLEGKEFCIERDRITHVETYCTRDELGNETLDKSKTFVNFKSPNHKSRGSLHAIVDMSLRVFMECVMRPAFQSPCEVQDQ